MIDIMHLKKISKIVLISLALSQQCFAVGIQSWLNRACVTEDISPEWGFWLRPYYEGGKQRNHGDLLGYRSNISGFILGVDNNFTDRLTFGMGAAAGQSIIKSINFYSTATYIDTYQGMVYGSYKAENSLLYNLILTGAHNAYNAHTGTNTPTNTTAYADYAGQQYTAELIISSEQCYKKFYYTPRFILDYVYLHQQAYTETGPGAATQNINDNFANVLTLGLGINLDKKFCIKKSSAKLEIAATALYDVVADKLNTTTTFATAGPAIVTTARPDRFTGIVGAGFDINLPGRFACKFSYDLQLKDKYYNNVFYITLRQIF